MAGGFLAQRRREPELMDDPAIRPAELERALATLARVHRLSGTAARLAAGLARHFPAAGGELAVADLACGGGELTRALARALAGRGVRARVTGFDQSPLAVERGRRLAAGSGLALGFEQRDLVAAGLPEGYDVFVSALFLHHLDEAALADLLRAVADRARRGCLFHDLDRTRLGYALASVGPRLLGRSRVAIVDGQLSVRAALRPAEVLALAEANGLLGAEVQRCFPERWQLVWRRA
jgi:2-polyprenyl-3-methyl-5-hydroxy-6-metoxy-1,4-benzoquinol methylase